MIEQAALAVLGLGLTYLIKEINEMQENIKDLLLDVAVLKERSQRQRATDTIDIER